MSTITTTTTARPAAPAGRVEPRPAGSRGPPAWACSPASAAWRSGSSWPWSRPGDVFPAYLGGLRLLPRVRGRAASRMLMIHHLTGGNWGFLIRRPLEAATMTLPLHGPALPPPFSMGMKMLYPWAAPGGRRERAVLLHKAGYFNVPFFLLRAVCTSPSGGPGLLHPAGDDPGRTPPRTRRDLADPGRQPRPASSPSSSRVTFAMVDWPMSIEPEWYSSIYAVMMFVGSGLSDLWRGDRRRVADVGVRPLTRWLLAGGLNDVGNLLLAFTMLWAYMSFSQYLIIWSGNLSEEVPWYIKRSLGGLAVHLLRPDGVPLLRAVLLPADAREQAGAGPALAGRHGDPRDAPDQRRLAGRPGVPGGAGVEAPGGRLPPRSAWGGWVGGRGPAGCTSRTLVPLHDPLLAEALGQATTGEVTECPTNRGHLHADEEAAETQPSAAEVGPGYERRDTNVRAPS